MDQFGDFSEEPKFQFLIATFHHAHETYLVPDVLKKAYGEMRLEG